MRLDERAESPLGRLLLTGCLASRDDEALWPACRWPRDVDEENARYEAGQIFTRVVTIYGAQLGVPLVSAPAAIVSDDSLPADGEDDRGDRDPDFGCPVERFGNPDACRADPDNCRCRRRRERYDDAFEALAKEGNRVARAVSRVAVHREAIPEEDLIYLVDGLDALARLYRLTRSRRRRHYRNVG